MRATASFLLSIRKTCHNRVYQKPVRKKATNILKASEGSPGPSLSDDEIRFALCASPQTIYLEKFLVVFTANSQSNHISFRSITKTKTCAQSDWRGAGLPSGAF